MNSVSDAVRGELGRSCRVFSGVELRAYVVARLGFVTSAIVIGLSDSTFGESCLTQPGFDAVSNRLY
jgi:hypothetical protein